jgi:predicted GNAT family acetyltransferase
MIRPAEKNEVNHLFSLAKKEGICFCNSTSYFAFFFKGNVVAMTGVIWYAKKAVFKNSFVLPEYRKKGIYKQLVNHRLKNAYDKNINIIEATCTSMSLPYWLNSGASIVKQYKKFTKVQLKT